MDNKKSQKIFFWSIILIALLFSAGQTPKSSLATTNSNNLVINEFMAVNGSGLIDEEGEYSDWIELHNRGNTPINLAGWALTDDPNDPQKWPFPDVTLGSADYLVVFTSGKDRRIDEPGIALHTNFKLDREGDFLALYNILEDRLMDVITPKFPEQFRDISYGRYGAELAYGYLAHPTPGEANDESAVWAGVVAPVQFSAERGFYNAPFTIALTTATPGATIRYTVDGSEPSATNGTSYSQPITVDSTTLLRAMAFKPNFLPSTSETQTYIFLDDVLSQPAAPAGFPLSWGAQLNPNAYGKAIVSPVTADYAMDPAVVHDPRYHDTLTNDLQTLPSLSLVMSEQSLADLHTHPQDSDPNWERPVSVEWIDPTHTEPGFQINAGIKLQTEPEPGQTDPKHSFRLLFKRAYGPTELDYPIFPNSPSDDFDTLVLQPGAMNEPATYIRDAWLHTSQIDMSGLGTNSAYVHLYLNGLYWGVYHITERPDASFMAAYLGGKKEDWFLADQDGLLNQDSNSGGDRLAYLFTVLNYAGRFEDGSPEDLTPKYTEVASYFDPVQLSDTMILNWYSQFLDWPENNWRAAINRTDLGGRGKLFIWSEPNSLNEVQFGWTASNNPQFDLVTRLFQTLLQNPDFRMQLADRMYKHLANNGALADATAQARWLHWSQAIDQAMVAETARWGDATPEAPFTQEKWLKANETIVAQMNGHAARLTAWAREVGYYPKVDPPKFSQESGLVETGFNLTMNNPLDYGTIYYTTDGSDPRLPVTGVVGPTARAYTGPVLISTNTQVKARVLLNQASAKAEPVWSALHEANFSIIRQDFSLRITEIMYNPVEGDDFEFIELKNVGSTELDLANVSIDAGIYFAFPSDTPPLVPGENAVLVSNPTAFAERYPDVPIRGVYDGHFSNKGEQIVMTDADGELIIDFTYDDANGWPLSADGHGDSLVLAELDGDPNNPQNWRASTSLNGSPGLDDSLIGEVQHNR